MPRQIRQDGSAFENGKVVTVVIDDCGDPAVRRVLHEPGLFLNVLHDVDALEDVVFAISSLQLLEDDGSFLSIWGPECEELNAGFRNQASWAFRGRHCSGGRLDEMLRGLVDSSKRGVEHKC